MNMIHILRGALIWLFLLVFLYSDDASAQASTAQNYDPARWTNIRMTKLPGDINSEAPETVSCFNPTGDTLYFGTKRGTGKDQLWSCEYRNGTFANPTRITNSGRDAIGAVTIDKFGHAYLAALNSTSEEYPNNVDICEIDSTGKLRLLSDAINTMSWESQPHIDRDGNTLYFSAAINSRNSTTNVDIYSSQRQNGAWLPAKELEGSVNTRAYEGFPTQSPDGKILFFMRRKNNVQSMLYAKFDTEDAEWDDVEELPAPINEERAMSIAFHTTEQLFVIAIARGEDPKNFDLYEVRYDVAP
jgi:OmpA-OmpF porin, OOP family